MGLDRLEYTIQKEEEKVTEYRRKSEEKIKALIEETSQNLRISQVLKVIPTSIDKIITSEITTPKLEIKTEDNEYTNLLNFEYGNKIQLKYSNYQIDLSPKKIEVDVYGALETRKFTSFPIIEETYKQVASKLSAAISILKENQITENSSKDSDDLPF